MPKRTNSRSIESQAAGLSGGTGFAGIVLLMPDSVWKSVLLIIAPAMTVVISATWLFLTDELGTVVADWRIKNQRRRAERLWHDVNNDPNATPELKAQARENLEALTLLEVEIGKRRVSAIVDI